MMRKLLDRSRVLSLVGVLSVGLLAGARVGTTGRTTQVADKIDPAVQAEIDAGRTTQVIVLGRSQLFAPVGGLEAFAQQHAGDDRRGLRRQVVESLKTVANTEQQAILRSLGVARAERSLWIVNAIVLRLSPADVRKAAALEAVAFIYPAPEGIRVPAAAPPPVDLQPAVDRPPFSTEGKRLAWYLDKLNVPRVWRDLGVTGEGAVVASFDAGVNYHHDDLRANLWRNPGEVPNNGRDDDGNGYVDDIYGYDFTAMSPAVLPRDTTAPGQHGTRTSGIALGDGTGGIVTGVAPRARLMVMRAGGGVTHAALAYQYAIENGADIVSMSFSIPDLGHVRGLWRIMSDHAVAAGVVLVGGAGNFRRTATVPYQHQTPKDVPSVISVGGVDALLNMVPFSSAGPAEWGTVALFGDHPMPAGLIKPDVVAFPGAGYPVLSATSNSGYLDPNESVRGNSFSGPQGAGVAALLLSAAPATPAWRVREILEATAHDLGSPGKDNDFGAGLIDAYAAVRRARQ